MPPYHLSAALKLVGNGEQLRDRSKPPGVGAVIGWTALAAIAPGAAHLRAGWRRTGLTLLSVYTALLLGLLWVALTSDLGELAGQLVASSWLTVVTVVSIALGVAWFALIVHSFVVMNPGKLHGKAQIVTGSVAGVMAVGVLLPFSLVGQYAAVSQSALDDVFSAPATPRPQVSGVREQDPWAGHSRVNILLLGGDADTNRVGVRTDSINVASIDVKTGNTVLLSLPRNLENVRFLPGSPMAKRFPDGFRLPANPDGSREDLLFAVWEYADMHPEIFGGRKGQGTQTLMDTIGYTLNLKIDWYALVNIWGFARLIDAIGGVKLTVPQDVVFGKYNEGLVKAGTRKLARCRRHVVRPLPHQQRRLHPDGAPALRAGRPARPVRPGDRAGAVQPGRAGRQGTLQDRHPALDAGAPGPAGPEGQERQGDERPVRARR